MSINEIILIIAFSILGLCIIYGIIKLSTKSNETGERYNNACYILFIVSVVLIGVSQFIGYHSDFTLPSQTSPVYLDGVTVKASTGAVVGDTGTIDGVTYTPPPTPPTQPDRCMNKPKCQNGGVSVEKWPIDLSVDAQCVCNCVGGYWGN